MPVESCPAMQHPGYPRGIDDILDNGTSEEKRALVTWLRSKFDYGVLREVPVELPIAEDTTAEAATAELAVNGR